MKYPHFREMLTKNINEADILLGSASYDLSCSCGSGTSEAPKRLRELSSYLPCYDANFHLLSDVKIYDYCDVSPKNGVASFYQELEEKAKEMLKLDKFVLFFGGDHSISVPLEKAFYEKYHNLDKHPVIIHIDAHMDILVLSDYAEFAYKCTDFYHPDDEGGLLYNDPDIGVEWPFEEGVELILSDKDQKWSGIKEYTKGI